DQAADVAPLAVRSKRFRALRTEPLIFSPADPRALYFAGNTLWVTRDLGQSWKQISPDLSRKAWTDPAAVGMYRGTAMAKPTRRGVIYAVSPSPLEANLIWAGTDDGLVWITRDGGAHWTNVTPPGLTPWDKVSSIDAGHFAPGTTYIAINTLRLDQMTPRLYRTENYGRSWMDISNGLPDNAATDVLRQDTEDKNLLFAGTERQVWVSFNDGDQWHSLRMNMPATSIRDLEIKGDDLIAGTHGRGFWILDDITPLRQLGKAAAAGEAYLYRPETTYRVRWDTNTDTPLRPATPAGQNPPDGAILDYYLAQSASGTVTLAVYSAGGALVQRYSSANPSPPINPAELGVPAHWQRPPQPLRATAGEHRFIWNLHYAPAPGTPRHLPMQAVVHNTPFPAGAPWVLPGSYTVRLTVNGQTYSQPLRVVMDPRVKTPPAGLRQQFELSMRMYRGIGRLSAALRQARAQQAGIAALRKRASGTAAAALAAASRQLDAVAGRAGGGFFAFFGAPSGGAPTLASLRGTYFGLMRTLQAADVTPTAQATAAVAAQGAELQPLLARWRAFERSLPALNQTLQQAGLPPVAAAARR
ncbi:MAG: WD40/YVTN/BNR-like repeat-containing protein, partial [Terriglobales bacterium]